MKKFRNGGTCKLCNTTIESKHVHDFVTCKCGAFSVDGGSDYHRMVFSGDVTFKDFEPLDKPDLEDLVELDDLPEPSGAQLASADQPSCGIIERITTLEAALRLAEPYPWDSNETAGTISSYGTYVAEDMRSADVTAVALLRNTIGDIIDLTRALLAEHESMRVDIESGNPPNTTQCSCTKCATYRSVDQLLNMKYVK